MICEIFENFRDFAVLWEITVDFSGLLFSAFFLQIDKDNF